MRLAIPPLRFVVRRFEDGAILDTYREDELATYGTGKTWHEAACWGHIAIVADRRAGGAAINPQAAQAEAQAQVEISARS